MPPTKYLSTKQVRELNGNPSERTLYRWIKLRLLAAPEYVNGRRLWRENEALVKTSPRREGAA